MNHDYWRKYWEWSQKEDQSRIQNDITRDLAELRRQFVRQLASIGTPVPSTYSPRRDADEPLVTAGTAAYLADWFTKS